MKRFLCLSFMLLSLNAVFSQSLEVVKQAIAKADIAVAKKAIDVFLGDEKNVSNAEGWYYKGVVYNECSKKNDLLAACPNCKMEAFNAFKKYQILDPKNLYMLPEQNVRLFDIYNGFFDLASKFYEAKDFAKAYANFSNASIVEDYISGKGFEYNGFKFGTLDTSLVQNMALAARLAKMEPEAVKGYERLVAANLDGPSNLEMYQYLAEYYLRSKNNVALNRILEKGKKIYPADEYWTEVEIDQVNKNDKPALFAKYEEVMGKNPRNYSVAYNYSVELFNYLYVSDSRVADFDVKKSRLEEVSKKAMLIKNTPEANMIMARHFYNDVYDMQELIKKIKGASPEDAKKKQALKVATGKVSDECIRYTEMAIKLYATKITIKPADKANYKNAVGILANIYALKGNKAKEEEYKKLEIEIANL